MLSITDGGLPSYSNYSGQSIGQPLRGSSYGYSSSGSYSELAWYFCFIAILGVCNTCGAFSHYSIKCHSPGDIVPLAQSTLPIKAVPPPARGNILVLWGGARIVIEVLRQVGQEIS